MKKALLIVMMAGAATAAYADPGDDIDQNQPNNPAYMAAFSQGDLAQSFIQDNDNISGAGIFLQSGIGTSDTVVIELWDMLPPAGGTMLTSGSAVGTQGTWVDVFWDPFPVAADTTYYLIFTGNNTLGIAGDTSNPYPDGQVYANPGYQPFPTFDYTFRTYYRIPAPSSLALLGLGGLALRRRR